MDAITVQDKPAVFQPPRRPRESPGRLWQAPLFVVGVAAFLCFWGFRSYLSQGPSLCGKRDLDLAREALDRDNGDADEIAGRLQRLLDRGVPDEIAGEAHFLYGSAKLRAADSVSPGQARDYWLTAREQLQDAERIGVAEADKSKLQFRLGKVSFHLQSEPPKVVAERLAASVAAADDKAEGYNLLTQAYLRMSPPNLQAALDANEQLRQLKAPEDVLARARLAGGEILLRMQKPKEARELLERIGNQAPPPVLNKARMLRARSRQDEQKWAEAAALWRAALDDGGALPEAGLIRYNLGLCYRRLDQPPVAAPFWEECVLSGSGDEKYAAALGLADLYLQEGKGDKALEKLEFALHNVHKPDDWDNKLLDRTAACEMVERGCQTERQAGRFALALQLEGLYERLAAPGRAPVMRGDILTDWARARREAATKMPPPLQPAEEQAARDLFKQAAEAYELAAKKTTEAPAVADYLWLAAARDIEAGEQGRAQTLFEQLFNLTPRPDARLGEGWYLLGESFRKEARPGVLDSDLKFKAAQSAYEQCLNYQTPFAYWARYRLAQFKIEQKKTDDAVEDLELNIKLLAGEETEVKQRSRFTLVHIYYGAQKYKPVVQKMEEVLEHLPATREATEARFELADSYRLLADQQEQLLNDGTTYKDPRTRNNFLEVLKTTRTRAVEEFEKLVAMVENPETADHLSEEVRRDVYACAAYTRFQMGEFDKSLAAYEHMAQRYQGKPAYWKAVAGMVSSYTGKGDEKMVRKYLEIIQNGLPNMDAATKEEMQQYIARVLMSLERQPRP